MLRICLIAYLMVGAVAGPAWCCCTFERLATWCVPVSQAKPEAPLPSRCCHRQSPIQTRDDSDKPQDKNAPNPKESPCPCKEHQSGQTSPAILIGQESHDARWSGSGSDLAATLEVAVLSHDLELDPPHQLTPALFSGGGLSGRDILCAFQNFRC